MAIDWKKRYQELARSVALARNEIDDSSRGDALDNAQVIYSWINRRMVKVRRGPPVREVPRP